MPSISIATVDDASTILALQKAAYQSEARLYDDWTIPPLTQSRASLEDEIRNTTVLKALQEGVLIGSVRAKLIDNVCHIGRLVVDPIVQGRGIGTGMLRAIEERFCGASRFELFTGSRSEGNIRLYLRSGYAITGTRRLSEQVTMVILSKANLALT